jgi:CheY-like chemotaxis protein
MRFIDSSGRHSALGHILVVDDNEANRDLLARRLTRDGHRVALAENGAEALAAVAGQAFDLVLLDLMMPDISGYEVLGRLKADERTQELPVIMISALDEMDTIVRCIEAGAIDYLPKPFDPTLLRARIGSCLDNKLLRDRERQILSELRYEKDRNDALLHSILPHAIVERIKAGEGLIADDVPEVTILFADICDFTGLAGRMEASALVQLSTRCSRFSTSWRSATMRRRSRPSAMPTWWPWASPKAAPITWRRPRASRSRSSRPRPPSRRRRASRCPCGSACIAGPWWRASSAARSSPTTSGATR